MIRLFRWFSHLTVNFYDRNYISDYIRGLDVLPWFLLDLYSLFVTFIWLTFASIFAQCFDWKLFYPAGNAYIRINVNSIWEPIYGFVVGIQSGGRKQFYKWSMMPQRKSFYATWVSFMEHLLEGRVGPGKTTWNQHAGEHSLF